MVEFYVPPDLPIGLKYARMVKSFAIGLIYGPMSPSIYWVVGAGFLMGCASDACEPNEIEHQAAIRTAAYVRAAGTCVTSSRASTTTATRHVSPTRCARACATCSPSSSAATWA